MESERQLQSVGTELSSQDSLASNKTERKGVNPQQFLSFAVGDVRKPLSYEALDTLNEAKRAESCHHCIAANNLKKSYMLNPPDQWLQWYNVTMDQYKQAVAELLRLHQVAPAPGTQRRLVHMTSVDSFLPKTPTAQAAHGVVQYNQMTPIENQNQSLENYVEDTVVGTVTPHRTFIRRDEWRELEQEKQEMLWR